MIVILVKLDFNMRVICNIKSSQSLGYLDMRSYDLIKEIADK